MFHYLYLFVLLILFLFIVFHIASLIIFYIKSDIKQLERKYNSKRKSFKDLTLKHKISRIAFVVEIIVLFLLINNFALLFRPIVNLNITIDNFTGFIESVMSVYRTISFYLDFNYNEFIVTLAILFTILAVITIYQIVSVIIQFIKKEVVSKSYVVSIVSTLVFLYGMTFLISHVNELILAFSDVKRFINNPELSLEDVLNLETINKSRDYYNLTISTYSVLVSFYEIIKMAMVLKFVSLVFGAIELFDIDLQSFKFKRFSQEK